MSDESTGKQLMKDGVWQVPTNERPAGWETMGGREPIAASTEVVVHQAQEVTHVNAERIEDLPKIQGTLIDWVREKIERTKAEAKELWEAYQHALARKWKAGTLKKHWNLAVGRAEYYEKTLEALEAGYCLFPALQCEIFAVRTERDTPTYRHSWFRWNYHPDWEEQAELLPTGTGEYVNPVPPKYSYEDERQEGQAKVTGRSYSTLSEFDKIAFPFSMSKAHIMDAVGKAMALKIFDEIGIIGDKVVNRTNAKRRADPIIVGRIIHPKREGLANGRERALNFLISWHIDTKDLE